MQISLRFIAAAVCLLALPQSSPSQNKSSVDPAHPFEDIFGGRLPPQKIAIVFGQRIAYYDMGDAKPGAPVLVMLHGFGSQADVDFGPSLPALSRARRVLAIDQIGSGRSDKPLMQYRVQTYVEFLAEFLRVVGVPSFDLLGESLGGWTAAAYTEQALAPGSTLPKPRRLILEDAAGFTVPASMGTPMPPRMMVSTVDEVVTGLRAVFFDPARITPEVAKRRFISKLASNDGMVTSTFSSNTAVRNEAVGEKAKTITLPTLIVWGAEDHTIPLTAAHAFAEAIPGAKLIQIERSGHVPSLEQPVEFVNAVDAFLR